MLFRHSTLIIPLLFQYLKYYLRSMVFMATERTFSIIKPSAVAANNIGGILAKFEQAGLKIVAAKMLHLTRT